MRIDILKNCFRRDGSKAPSILKRNTVHTIPDDEAKELIKLGYAVELKEVEAEAPKKEEKKEEPKETTAKK